MDKSCARGSEWLATIGVSSLLVASIWVVTLGAGAIGIARSDDWSYLLTQFEFEESGQFMMNNWAVTMLIGQTLAAAPVVEWFGLSIAALQGFVVVLSVGALTVTYVLLRRALPVGWAAFAMVTLAVSPIFGPSVVSFMTDVPALLFLSLSLLVGVASIQGGKPNWVLFGSSGALAVIAFTFRDYAVSGIVAVVLVGLLVCRDRRDRFGLLAGLLSVVAVAGGLYVWRHSLPNDLRLDGWDLGFSIQLVARGMLTIALLSLPALAAIMWWSVGKSSGRSRALTFAGALVASIVVLAVAGFELLGNVIHPFGSTWLISGSGIRMWPLWANRLLLVLAVASLALLFVLAWVAVARLMEGPLPWWKAGGEWLRHDVGRSVIIVFPLLLLAAHTGATSLLGTWFIDRYFILVLPFLAAAVLIIGRSLEALVRRALVVVPIGVLVVYGVWGFYVFDFDARFDGARWQMGERLVEDGYAAHEVDAGMQWVSFHAMGVGLGAQAVPTRPGRQWWTERYPDQRVCVSVTAVDSAPDLTDEALKERQVSTLFGKSYWLVATPGPDMCEPPTG